MREGSGSSELKSKLGLEVGRERSRDGFGERAGAGKGRPIPRAPGRCGVGGKDGLGGGRAAFAAHRGFQEVEESGLWVHVQISGISRGWIRRSQVELPSEIGNSSSVNESNSEKDLFHQTREETSVFPGNWEPLRGKQVKIVWVQPSGMAKTDQDSRLNFAKRVFRKQYPELTKVVPSVAGVVVVFDSQDGGMAAATLATLQQWQAGHLTDDAFWKRCWLDPAGAFNER